jgi:hypothetical protein
MKPLTEMGGEMLTWTQLRTGYYTLRRSEGVFAHLRWQTMLGSLATAAAGEERWTFKRIGLQRPRITVRKPGEEKDVAVLKHTGRGEAVLEFGDGRRFLWRATRARRREKGFYDPDGVLVVRFSPQPLPGKLQAKVELARDAPAASDLTLLTLLGWYRLLFEMADPTATGGLGGSRTGRSPRKQLSSR